MYIDYSDFFILHGESNPTDSHIMRKVLNEIQYDGDYLNLAIGEEMIAWINDLSNDIPGLIMLNIGSSGFSGKAALKILKEHERTASVPIVMITDSNCLLDYKECIRLGANGYIKKLTNHQLFSCACQNFIQGWAQLKEQKYV